MQKLGMTLAIVAAAFVFVPAALAQQPTREYTPISGFTSVRACGFTIVSEPLQNQLFTLTFPDGRQITTGAVKVRLTNPATGESVQRNISGPGRILEDGTLIAMGPWLIRFFPGEVEPGSPSMLAITHGRVVFDPEGNVVSVGGAVENLCLVLAAP